MPASRIAPNIIDRVVGWVSPKAGYQRSAYRAALARAYEGASKKDGWNPRRGNASANADHNADAGELRARGRSLYQNVPYIKKGVESHLANLIGTGITPRSSAANERDQGAFNAALKLWFKGCDADGRTDYFGLQLMRERAKFVDGEVLIRLRPRRLEDANAGGYAIPLQLQILEIDWLDSSKNGVPNDTPNHLIVNGIEYDQIGRPSAYWLWPEHPGEIVRDFRRAKTQSYRVPASSIIHYFNAERPGQGRGISRLAPVIARTRDFTLYEDAERQRKNLETRLSVIASGDVAALANTVPQIDANGQQISEKNAGELGALASGGITQIPAGMSVNIIEPKAAPGYVDYGKWELHLIAAGMGVMYEMLTGDVRETTFSSARFGAQEYRTQTETERWVNVIPTVEEKIMRALWLAARDAGIVNSLDLMFAYGVPKWQYVNPVQDVEADVKEIANLLGSPSEKIRARGYTPSDVFDEIDQDAKRLGYANGKEMAAALRGDPSLAPIATNADPPPASKKKTA